MNDKYDHLILCNDDKGGLLTIYCININESWHDFKKTSTEKVMEEAAKWVEMAEKKLSVDSHEVYPEDIMKTHRNWVDSPEKYRPEKLFEITFSTKKPSFNFSGSINIWAYPCLFPKTAAIIMIFVSEFNSIEENLKSYQIIVESFRAYGDRSFLLEN